MGEYDKLDRFISNSADRFLQLLTMPKRNPRIYDNDPRRSDYKAGICDPTPVLACYRAAGSNESVDVLCDPDGLWFVRNCVGQAHASRGDRNAHQQVKFHLARL